MIAYSESTSRQCYQQRGGERGEEKDRERRGERDKDKDRDSERARERERETEREREREREARERLSFKISNTEEIQQVLLRTEKCIAEIRAWMLQNKLMIIELYQILVEFYVMINDLKTVYCDCVTSAGREVCHPWHSRWRQSDSYHQSGAQPGRCFRQTPEHAGPG